MASSLLAAELESSRTVGGGETRSLEGVGDRELSPFSEDMVGLDHWSMPHRRVSEERGS